MGLGFVIGAWVTGGVVIKVRYGLGSLVRLGFRIDLVLENFSVS